MLGIDEPYHLDLTGQWLIIHSNIFVGVEPEFLITKREDGNFEMTGLVIMTKEEYDFLRSIEGFIPSPPPSD